MKYNHAKIEKKWQQEWLKRKTYEPDLKKAKKPFYNLMMFPYPSAEGLHIGGVRTFVGVDIYGRYKRLQGFDTFEPIGLDGFGIHSENYALKTGKHPADQAKITEKNFYRQLASIGNGFAWEERLETYDPEYYKWTQWIFIQMFKHGLAYRKKATVNWCPKDKTVLADEQVIAGECERCGEKVIKRELEQWFFRITDYAERLLKNLETLQWDERIKIAQRNWIGKSEGALLRFSIPKFQFQIEVFTTRPDTLFGATYVVLAPEHPFVDTLEPRIQNLDEVREYVKASKAKAEEERIAEGKEKSGVELKGVKAINPATKEEIPVFIADYVLASYGTGAIMAVPAHDERDYAFAKKFELPIVVVVEPVTGVVYPKEEYRRSIVAVVENPETGKFLSINWGNKLGGNLFVGGGREWNEDITETARREVQEETGYKNLEFVGKTETVHHHYFATSKNVYREIEAVGMHFKLVDYERVAEQLEDNEKGLFSIDWLTKEEVLAKVRDELHAYVFRKLILEKVYTGPGILANSGKFTGMKSEKAKWEITKFVGGKRKVQYHLRDWLISRQRYWGPPIPMIFCESCSVAQKGEQKNMPGWYAVPEKSLPVKLPRVADFRPTGTDQSPLASAESFYKVRCPGCNGWARRETDVSDTFLDSAWYYLRYPSVKDTKHAWDPAITKKWLPVNMYIGGAEHAVLHLMYMRFVTMALKDMKLLPLEEPVAEFRAHGLITKDGAKMSKSKGNVVNPDDYLGVYGVDTMRMYLSFLAPLTQGGDFHDDGIRGITRFLERVWKLYTGVFTKIKTPAKSTNKEIGRKVHQAIKKVGEDIEDLRYNTAISTLMVLLTEFEQHPELVSKEYQEAFLKLLAPFAPHMTEELWSTHYSKSKTKSIHREAWPKVNARFLQEDTFELVIQINGKVRDRFSAAKGITREQVLAFVQDREEVKRFIEGKEFRKVIFVPDRLLNIVVG